MKVTIIILGILFLCAGTPSYSQVTLQLGGGLGLVSPTGDMSGTTIDYYGGQKFGLSTGFILFGKARLGLLGFNIVGEVSYTALNNDGNSEPGKGSVKVSQSVLAVKAGPEFKLNIPASPVTPYLGFQLALNRFSGETTFQGVSKVPSATYSVESASRFGIGFNGGVLIGIGTSLSLDVSAGYNLLNVGGRSFTDVNPSQKERIDSYLALNDAKDPLYQPGDDKNFIAGERSMSSFQFVVGVMFGI
ncbi:MAG TPA: hypothetical protein VGB89_16145 [Bacteroidota bacterium]